MKSKIEYVLQHFRAIYGLPASVQIGYGVTDRQINVAAAGGDFFSSLRPYPPNQAVWKEWKERSLPILFSQDPHAPLIEMRAGKAFIGHDILASAFFFLSNWQEHVFMRRHSLPRYPYSQSLQNALGISRFPVVNYYFDILKTAVEQACRLQLTPGSGSGHPLMLCLTHDIDSCRSGWRQDAFHQLRRGRLSQAGAILYRRLRGQDTWDNLPEILEIERAMGATSSFYFIARHNRVYLRPATATPAVAPDATGEPAKNSAEPLYRESPAAVLRGYSRVERNADYRISDEGIQRNMQAIEAAGSEVGVHGAFGAHLNADRLRSEIQAIGRPVAGGRFHFLQFDVTRSFDVLEAAGLCYDSTLGFAEEIGFRNGIAHPFRPYNLRKDRPHNIVEIPLAIMDTTFRVYQKTPHDEILPQIVSLLDEAARFGGCLTILWHNNYFSPYKFAGWAQLYRQILEEGRKRRGRLLHAAAVYQEWAPRLLRDSAAT